MKISKFSTLFILLASALDTALVCVRAVTKRLLGSINRSWVDATIQSWVNRTLKRAKIQCHVINPHAVSPRQGQATIIMCNHRSLYDIPLSFKAFPNTSLRMLAKKELSRIPLMGQGMAAAEFPFIDRKNRHQAIQDLLAAQQLMESGIVMWIAPEGTRSKEGRLAPFKKGGFITAINTGAQIIPIGIRGAANILPPKSWQLHLNQVAEIHIGTPINAAHYTLAEKERLLHDVFTSMQKLVGESS